MSVVHTVGGGAKTIVESIATSSLPPEEILQQLDSCGIEWYPTEQGDLIIRYWQVVGEGFVSPEHVGRIQIGRQAPEEAPALEWVSRNLADLTARYAGQWVAVAGNGVIASAPTLPDLLRQAHALGVEGPFVTQIPTGPVVWTTAYARQGI